MSLARLKREYGRGSARVSEPRPLASGSARGRLTAHKGIPGRAAYWAAAPLVCLLLYWRSFQAWFRGDDFAWLGIGQNVHTLHDLLLAAFTPFAQGTIRPFSDRLFFMAGFAMFGLDSLPYRLVVFGTQFVNLALVASIGARMTGRRAAGLCAAILWAVHSSALEPLGWVCVYNQVLCAFFLLLAFHFLLRLVETGARRFEIYMWIAFVLGFGAQELNLVFPALAAAYTFWCAQKYFRRTLPMFAVTAIYVAIHLAAAGRPTGDYAMHFTGAMLRTLARYWTWSAGPSMLWTPWALPQWMVLLGVAAVTLGLAWFLARRWRGPALFCAAWYLIAIAPVLPLRDHRMQYYVFIPLIGICWLGGWALAEAWTARPRARIVATAMAALYLVMVVPRTLAASNWNYRITMRERNLVESVAGIHQLHPGKWILLDGVDADLFWNGILDRPFRLIGIDRVYLAPGTDRRIAPQANLGDVAGFVLESEVVDKALERGEMVVYDVRGPQLRNITSAYAAQPRAASAPLRVDAANPLTAYLLGPEWYRADRNHRWMPKVATLRMGAPAAPGQRLYLQGTCPEEQLRNGPLQVTVSVDGRSLGSAAIQPGEIGFVLSFPLPDSLVGRPAMGVTVEVSRTIRPSSDPRDLGLAFGAFAVR